MLKLTTLAFAILPLAALAEVRPGDPVGITDNAITAALQDAGYIIEEIEREGGEIEAEVTLNGVEFYIDISPVNGSVLYIDEDD